MKQELHNTGTVQEPFRFPMREIFALRGQDFSDFHAENFYPAGAGFFALRTKSDFKMVLRSDLFLI